MPAIIQRLPANFGSGLALATLFLGIATAHPAIQTNLARPFPTGTHQQLVRRFFKQSDGLPSDVIRAIAVNSGGSVVAATDKGLASQQGERWIKENGPVEVRALFPQRQDGGILAGASNGIWLRSGAGWTKDSENPSSITAFASEPDDTPWALARSGVWRRDKGWKRVHDLDEDISHPRSLLPLSADEAIIASDNGLFGLMGKRKYWLPFELQPGGLMTTNTRALAHFGPNHFLVATECGLQLSNGKRGWVNFTGEDGLPVLDLTIVAPAPDGSVWLGSDQGLILWRRGEWIYLAGQRWLPDDNVTAIAPALDGSVWVGTKAGLAHLFWRSLTLEEKAAIYQRDLQSRDRRHGFVTQMELRAPGQLEGALQEISDNDGLWTAMYVASQAFRYAVTHSSEAKEQAARSLKALLRLESITGISGFPARAICRQDEPPFAARSIRSDSEWHSSPVETGWHWKGETSSDEIVGHYFGWYLFYELAANDSEKEAIRATCKRVTDHLLDHNYYLLDHDGKPTTWGVWAPEKLNDDPVWWDERGLGSLEILSHLKVAEHIVGDPRYRAAYKELIEKHHYALNTVRAKLATGVSHDNQLLLLSYYPLLQLERDPNLRAIYIASLKRTWDFERVEGNPLWNFIYGASTGEACDVEAAVQALREMPLDFVLWKTRNSHRADLKFDPNLAAKEIRRLIKPLPWTERLIHTWDHSPFVLDGGNAVTEEDQTIWLLPYWMGRHHRLIE